MESQDNLLQVTWDEELVALLPAGLQDLSWRSEGGKRSANLTPEDTAPYLDCHGDHNFDVCPWHRLDLALACPVGLGSWLVHHAERRRLRSSGAS
jgi:hypothetical protein